MSDKKVLQQVIKGAGLLFVGTLSVYILKFIYRLVVSRYLGPSDYGLLSLGEGVLNIAFLFSILGLHSGAVKFISHYIGEGLLGKIKGTILSVFKLVIPISIITSTLIIIFSEYIAVGLFNNEKLVPILVIFAFAVPFYAFSNILANIFIAFKKIQYRNYLGVLARALFALILVMVIIPLKGNVYFIALALLSSHILPAILGSYLLEFKTFSIFKSKIKADYDYKKLLYFSLPLFFSGIFISIMGWMDTFFLGALKTTSEVGIYNVVLPLVSTLTIFISAFGNIFFPISSELYAQKKYSEISKTYSSVSRWMFLLSFPIFLIVLTFSKDILRILFGSAYEPGAAALQILIIAYFIAVVIGPASYALMTFNKTKTLFYISSIAAVLNFFLNYAFISKYGLIGAAMATSISILLRDGTLFLIVRKKLRFTYSLQSYLKYIIGAALPLLLIFVIIRDHLALNILTSIIIFIVYDALYLFFLIFLRAFTKDDLMIIESIERKTGISLKIIKKPMKYRSLIKK